MSQSSCEATISNVLMRMVTRKQVSSQEMSSFYVCSSWLRTVLLKVCTFSSGSLFLMKIHLHLTGLTLIGGSLRVHTQHLYMKSTLDIIAYIHLSMSWSSKASSHEVRSLLDFSDTWNPYPLGGLTTLKLNWRGMSVSSLIVLFVSDFSRLIIWWVPLLHF